jgi:NAD(P)H-hydrate epimerase
MLTPTLDRSRIRELDRRAIEEYGIPGMVLMENAGRGVADKLCELGIAGQVVICCGRGNNGGDGFVVARHLDIRGHDARVLMWSDPGKLSGDAAANFRILQRTDVPIGCFLHGHDPGRLEDQLAGAAWIVDALLGTGAQGEPRSPLDAVIDQLNAAEVPRMAVDLPSGLDCDTGEAAVHTIRADHTCTFVAAKPGFSLADGEQYTGQVHVVEIGAPRKLVERMLGKPGPT